jgi:hypothetical protein
MNFPVFCGFFSSLNGIKIGQLASAKVRSKPCSQRQGLAILNGNGEPRFDRNIDGVVADRMRKLNTLGAEVDTGVGIGTFGSVLEVTLDGMAHGLHLAANLVVPSGFEVYLESAVPVSCSD